jgi:hypothetical protein
LWEFLHQNTLFDRKTFDNKNSCIDEVRKYRDIHPGYHGGDPKYRDIHLGYHGGDPKYRDIYVFTPSSISFLTTLLSSAIK